jgi:hypothetical protein
MRAALSRKRFARQLGLAALVLGTALAAFGVGSIIFAREDTGPADSGNDGAAAVGQPASSAGTHDPAHPIAGNFKPDDTQIADCKGDFKCLEQAFGNLAYTEGPRPTIRVFDQMMRTDDAVEGNCHRIVHSIGSASLARYDGNVAKAFAEGSASCWSGYYHGILERAFVDADPDDLGTISRRLCDDEGIRATDYLAYQCVHGLGHGLMIYTGYNLPVSLKICDQLATDWDQSSCTGGVFMENISSSYGFTSQWLKEEDVVYPCNWVAERHKYYCYLMVTSRILQQNGYDWQEAAETCTGVEKSWIEICFQSFGRDASGSTRQNAPEIIRLCGLAGRWEDDCVYGAARDITSNDAGAQRAPLLCERAAASLRPTCFNGIGTILRGLSASEDDVRAACAAATTRYLDSCLRGAGLAS